MRQPAVPEEGSSANAKDRPLVRVFDFASDMARRQLGRMVIWVSPAALLTR
jgi:hypothetical protein